MSMSPAMEEHRKLLWRGYGYANKQSAVYADLTGPPPPLQLYRPLSVPCDFCGVALSEAVNMGLPASKVYTIHVHPREFDGTRSVLHDWTRTKFHFPLAPQVNVVPDNRLNRFEWYIEANGVAIGSAGP